ncbi:MAG: phosphatase PAP2 family protein [Chitinophagaceae bacterium]|jgi:undecaprenyl-diphosphatase|nr:phosphatase PAP2 family protein [Chitinophagaceae bacterium]
MKKLVILFSLSFFSLQLFAQNLDINILKKINTHLPVSGVWKGFSSSAYPVSAATPIAQFGYGYFSKNKTEQKNGIETAMSIASSAIIAEGFKVVINRDRPWQKYPTEVFPQSNETGQSFPSGHTTLAFATATSLTLEYKKWYIAAPAYLWAASVGYSRLYLGMHYPSDVFAGAVIGVGSGFLSHWITHKIYGAKLKVKSQD